LTIRGFKINPYHLDRTVIADLVARIANIPHADCEGNSENADVPSEDRRKVGDMMSRLGNAECSAHTWGAFFGRLDGVSRMISGI